MSQILSAIQNLKQYKLRFDKVYIEDARFRLFSKVTAGCLFFCAGLVTMQQLVGEHIKCILPPKEDVRSEALNQYCFVMSTYTVPNLYNSTIGVESAHFGVGPHSPEEDEQRYHYYYQWVPFALFFQAMSFMVPHYLWKVMEAGRIKAYCDQEVAPKVSLRSRKLLNGDEIKIKEKSISRAAVCFVGNMSYNKSYAIFYTICELLNFCMVLLNFYFTNKFIGYNYFKNYGPESVSYASQDDPDADAMSPMNRAFPKVAKCDFHKYGPSGNIMRYDILCVLALNIINEKIYMFLWFWFVVLAVVGGLALIYRIIKIVLPGIRNKLIRKRVSRGYRSSLNDVLNQIGYADWFVLELISDNLDSLRFGELCEGISVVLKKRQPNGRLSTSPPPSYMRNEKDLPDHDDPLIA